MTETRPPAVRGDDALQAVMEIEAGFVQNRRKVSKVRQQQKTTGLALSGGGIRSATFSLGILQALSRQGLIKHLDYLSTVSGGSYIGSFFGALYTRPLTGADDQREDQRLTEAEREARDMERQRAFIERPLQSLQGRTAVSQLREFGRYLTPGGFSDTLFGFGLIARNWISLQVVIGMLPLLLFLLLRLVQTGVEGIPGAWKFDLIASAVNPSGDAAALGSPPWLLFTLSGLFGITAAGLGMSYWFSRRDFVPRRIVRRLVCNFPIWAALGAIALLYWILRQELSEPWKLCSKQPNILPGGELEAQTIARNCSSFQEQLVNNGFFAALLLGLVVAVVAYLLAAWAQKRAEKESVTGDEAEERVRSRLTRSLSRSIYLALVTGIMSVIALLGQRIASAIEAFDRNMQDVSYMMQLADAYGAALLFLRYFWPFLAVIAPALLTVWAHSALRRGQGPGWLSRSTGQALLGLSILLFWLALWAAIAYSVPSEPWDTLAYTALAVFAALVGQSFCHGFLNLSSLVTLYSTRLKQAYVGASNPGRDEQGFETDRPGDHIKMGDYYGAPDDKTPRAARPVHLINMTAAQTEPDGKSRIVAHDRKGKPFHISPAGIIFQSERYGDSQTMAFADGEPLTLSGWTAISGAAASTAIGAMTSAGLSILAMMANVRLGYWWRTGIKRWRPRWTGYDTVLGYLMQELQGSFSASSDRYRWYLTDGGHFENTGAYALLQRRLDFIIVCDNGADPDYRLDDIVRLVQRARTDLNTAIRFLNAKEIEAKIRDPEFRSYFGEYKDIASTPKGDGEAAPYAALAEIVYDLDVDEEEGRTRGLMMLIKPRLNFNEPPELLAYRKREAGKTFPQQTTLDQFFDEEQWEAYRRFGEHVGEALFGKRKAGWSPQVELKRAAAKRRKEKEDA